ncbi:hypothetical protein EV175_007422, partial [Coemansia sp. RSA 1933]
PTDSSGRRASDGRVVQDKQSAAYGSGSGSGPDDLLAYRMRADTGTTTSGTATLRTQSDGSVGAESAIDVLKAEKSSLESGLKQSEAKRAQLDEELKVTKKRIRDFEEKRNALQLEMKHSLSSSIIADGSSSKDSEIAHLTDENEALKNECDALKRQLDDARHEIQAHTESALAAVSSLNFDSDEDVGG